MRKLIFIEGMSCGHCAMKVKSELQAADGVTGVEVDIVKKSAMVEGEGMSESRLRAAVAAAGYRVSRVI
jgi:copper chaperone